MSKVTVFLRESKVFLMKNNSASFTREFYGGTVSAADRPLQSSFILIPRFVLNNRMSTSGLKWNIWNPLSLNVKIVVYVTVPLRGQNEENIGFLRLCGVVQEDSARSVTLHSCVGIKCHRAAHAQLRRSSEATSWVASACDHVRMPASTTDMIRLPS